MEMLSSLQQIRKMLQPDFLSLSQHKIPKAVFSPEEFLGWFFSPLKIEFKQ